MHAGKKQSFYNLALMFLIKVARHVKSTKDRTLIILFQYIKKKVSKLLFRSIVMLRGPVMFVITCCLNHDILIGRYSFHCNDKNYLLVIILHQASKAALRKKCLYSELFWSVFFRIRTEYGEIIRISPCSVWMRENTDYNNSKSDTFYAVLIFSSCQDIVLGRHFITMGRTTSRNLVPSLISFLFVIWHCTW